ncbi:gas vesicle protein GvpN [Priestia filamentosa]|uniref:gas vesicle protein GvpN n=1 Tax=Priestia filamentosa TaxID=1402861 RepID=UPI001FB4759E|nr:gas vesicle protein GvpN [Priestia filamentosa]MED3726725.1 gas vesicle protein GvpN [Priestia filamentosa]UOE60092.1 gas vesicle protein GvpN [Priestia filamentosa]
MEKLQERLNNEFILYPELEDLADRAVDYLSARFPVHFTGPSGVGKTSLALYVASRMNRPLTFLQGNYEMRNEDLLGGMSGYTSNKTVDNFVRSVRKQEEKLTENRVDGRLVKAVKNGHTVVYDEFTRSKPETNNLFLSVVEEGILPLYGIKGEESHIPVHPDFSIIFTSNPEEYVGTYRTQDALQDRMITIDVDTVDERTEAYILKDRTEVSDREAAFIITFMKKIRSKCMENGEGGPGLRSSIMIGSIAQKAKIEINPDNGRFQKLIFDIIEFTIHRNLGYKSKEQTRNYLVREMKKLWGGN